MEYRDKLSPQMVLESIECVTELHQTHVIRVAIKDGSIEPMRSDSGDKARLGLKEFVAVGKLLVMK